MMSSNLIKFEDFAKIGFRIGKILSVRNSPKARKPSYILDIDFGVKGIRRSSAQLPANYSVEQLEKKIVIGVVNLPPRRIAGVESQVLVVGFPDQDGNVLLLNVEDKQLQCGHTLEEKGTEAEQITYDDFQKADIRSATIVDAKELDADQRSFHVQLDVGEDKHRESILRDVEDITCIIGKQVASVINLEYDGCYNATILTIMNNNMRYPLGVDGKVANGKKLF